MNVVLKALDNRAFQCRQLGNLAWAIATLGADEPEVSHHEAGKSRDPTRVVLTAPMHRQDRGQQEKPC